MPTNPRPTRAARLRAAPAQQQNQNPGGPPQGPQQNQPQRPNRPWGWIVAVAVLAILLIGLAVTGGFTFYVSSKRADLVAKLEKEKSDAAALAAKVEQDAAKAKADAEAALAEAKEEAAKATEDLKNQLAEQSAKADAAIAAAKKATEDAQKAAADATKALEEAKKEPPAPAVSSATPETALPSAAAPGMGFRARLVTSSSVPNAEMRNPEAFSKAHVGAQIDVLSTDQIYSRETGEKIEGQHCIYFRFPGNKPGAEYYCNVDLGAQGYKLPLDLSRLEAAGYKAALVRVPAQPTDFIRPEDAAKRHPIHTRGTLVWMKAGPLPPPGEIARMAEQKS
jgi:hypothetical protein